MTLLLPAGAALVLGGIAIESVVKRNKEVQMSRYKVVINHEEQYSIWPVERELPGGWKDAGKSGSRQDCHDYIEEVWTDMRPLSPKDRLRKLAEMEKRIQRDAGR